MSKPGTTGAGQEALLDAPGGVQLQFVLAQGFLQAAPLGDVANHGGRHRAAIQWDRAHGDLGKEFTAVLAARPQVSPRSQSQRAESAPEELAVAPVGAAQAVGYEDLHRAAQQFLPGVAEHQLGLRVEQNDLAARVDHQHGVGGKFDDPAEPLADPGAQEAGSRECAVAATFVDATFSGTHAMPPLCLICGHKYMKSSRTARSQQ